MNGLPAGLCMLMDTPQGDRQPGLRMLDGRDRPARLAFDVASAGGMPHGLTGGSRSSGPSRPGVRPPG